jgi:hypothetical protein
MIVAVSIGAINAAELQQKARAASSYGQALQGGLMLWGCGVPGVHALPADVASPALRSGGASDPTLLCTMCTSQLNGLVACCHVCNHDLLHCAESSVPPAAAVQGRLFLGEHALAASGTSFALRSGGAGAPVPLHTTRTSAVLWLSVMITLITTCMPS